MKWKKIVREQLRSHQIKIPLKLTNVPEKKRSREIIRKWCIYVAAKTKSRIKDRARRDFYVVRIFLMMSSVHKRGDSWEINDNDQRSRRKLVSPYRGDAAYI